MSNDAAFREAVLDLLGFYQPYAGSQGQRDSALARVLALYAERQGGGNAYHGVRRAHAAPRLPEHRHDHARYDSQSRRPRARRQGGDVNDYLCILGLSMANYAHAEPNEGAPMMHVKAETADEAYAIFCRAVGSFGDVVFVIPAYRREEPPDRRGLTGATIIRSIVP